MEMEKFMNKKCAQRKTPLMGWASWNCFRTGISEEILKQQADALVNTGLAARGYCYFNIDDGFFGGRDAEGKVQTHPERFPNGMKVMADYAHSRGLKAGTYAEAGDNTCGYYYDQEGGNGAGVGLYGHEEQDLRQYLAEWGFDFIKVDWCGGIRMGLDEKEQYTRIGKIIEQIRQEQNRSIVYNICRWQFPGPWAAEVADSWRTGADISPDFDSVVYQLDMIKPLRRFCGPGHVNDLDMLQVGNGMTPDEDQAHFAMWCMMSTPLMLGCDLTKISPELLELLGNEELIAIHQDTACLQAFVVKEIRSVELKENEEAAIQVEIWIKDLGKADSETKAAAFLNRSREPVTISVTLEELGMEGAEEKIQIRDVIRHCDIPTEQSFSIELDPHSCVVYRIQAERALPVQEISQEFTEYTQTRIPMTEAAVLVQNGAVFIDVRERAEYEKNHLEGAVHSDYSEIHANARHVIPDKDCPVVVYCNTGKKSSQAARSLFTMGYRKVWFTSVYA